MNENDEPTKRCRRCGRILPASAFSPDYKNADGLASYCRRCNCLTKRRERGISISRLLRRFTDEELLEEARLRGLIK